MDRLYQERTPVRTIAELSYLDSDEIVAGYRDGFAGEPCGGNRSRSYWHGWRNAQIDKGRMPPDDAARSLAAETVRSWPKP